MRFYLGVLLFLLIGCAAVQQLAKGHKPFRTSLGHVVYVPVDFPKVDFGEHKFIRSKIAHRGRGIGNRQKITEENMIYVRVFARQADFGITSYLEAYVPQKNCRKGGLIYQRLGILETWRKRRCPMEEVWGICIWPSASDMKPICIEQDPKDPKRLIWVRRYWDE